MSIGPQSHVYVCGGTAVNKRGWRGGKGRNWMEISLHWKPPLKPHKKLTDRKAEK